MGIEAWKPNSAHMKTTGPSIPRVTGSRESRASMRPARAPTRASSSGLRSAASWVEGQRSLRKRTGFSPESCQRCGLMSWNTAGPSGSQLQA